MKKEKALRLEKTSHLSTLITAGGIFLWSQSYLNENGFPPPNEYPDIFLLIRVISAVIILPSLVAFISVFFTDFKSAPAMVKICRIITLIFSIPIWLVIVLNVVLGIIALSLILLAVSVFLSGWLAEPQVVATVEFTKDIFGAPILIIKGWL